MFGLSQLDSYMIIIGAVSLMIWWLLYLNGLRYGSMFDSLDDKEFRFKSLYGMGYGILQAIHYKYKSKGDRKLRQQLEVLYGEKYCEYYLRVIHSQQISMAITVFVLSFAVYGLSAEIAAFVIMLMFSGVAYYYFGTLTSKKLLARSEQLLHDFSEVVSKLALLTNAGMILKEAWQEVAFAGDGIIYSEMRTTVSEMNNGVAEIDAIYNFGMRCMIPEVKKFASTVMQGMEKGSGDLSVMLTEQSKEVWQMKKQLVRREGEKASSKLLFPLCIMFIGVLIMILVPIFANL